MTKNLKVQRRYKDTVFRMLFNNKKELLKLYNSLNGTDYTNYNDVTITTLDNAVYMGVKNDISFIFQFHMYLYEHQSTYNPNMPLRNLIYVSKQLEKYLADSTIYSSKLIKFPTPKFVVFYNGIDEMPERQTLRLSDAFETPKDKNKEMPDLELKVLMLNINLGYNKEITEACNTLYEYCRYVDCVRRNAKECSIEEAVEKAVSECIKNGILSDFLKKQRAEVVAMSILEYDEEVEMKKIRQSEYMIGKEEGLQQGIEQGIEQGIQKGMIEGQIQAYLEFNLSKEEISKRLNISIEEVERIITSFND